MPTATEVLVERAARDVDETLDHLQKRLAAESRGPLLMLEKVVFGLVHLLGPQRRIRRDIEILVTLAERVRQGDDPARLAHEHLESTLRPWELNLVVRVKHPQFQRILALAETVFAQRLPDFARMASVEDPEDYADLVRRAFPDRAHVDAIIAANAVDVMGILDAVATHPEMVRIPRHWTPKLMGIAREMVTWKLDEVRLEVDAIYAATGGS